MSIDDEPPDPDFTCWNCEDWGFVYRYGSSTDAILGTRPCVYLNDPAKHPPAAPVPVTAILVTALGHMPGCDGSCGYPGGCPPF